MGNQNRGGLNSNSYNSSWRQHPNFSRSNPGAAANASMLPTKPVYQQGPSYQQGYPNQVQQQRAPQPAQLSSLESMMKEFMARTNTTIQGLSSTVHNL